MGFKVWVHTENLQILNMEIQLRTSKRKSKTIKGYVK